MSSVQISQAARSKLKLWRNGIEFGERIKTIGGGFMRNFGKEEVVKEEVDRSNTRLRL